MGDVAFQKSILLCRPSVIPLFQNRITSLVEWQTIRILSSSVQKGHGHFPSRSVSFWRINYSLPGFAGCDVAQLNLMQKTLIFQLVLVTNALLHLDTKAKAVAERARTNYSRICIWIWLSSWVTAPELNLEHGLYILSFVLLFSGWKFPRKLDNFSESEYYLNIHILFTCLTWVDLVHCSLSLVMHLEWSSQTVTTTLLPEEEFNKEETSLAKFLIRGSSQYKV